MKTVLIHKNDANQRVDKFLSKTFKRLPISAMYKAIRKKNVKLNGKRCKEYDILCENDVLSIYIDDVLLINDKVDYEFKKAPNKLKILYEDDNVVIIDKSVGIPTHPDKNFHFDCALNRLHKYLYENGEYHPESEHCFSPAFVNRLDRNTGGLIIAAKNAASLKIINEKIRQREIEKYYLCEVLGKVQKSHDICKAYLLKDQSKNKVFISDKALKGYKEIITEYSLIERRTSSSLLEIHLITGRTHQIRAHLAHIGYPIKGDSKYSANAIKTLSKEYKRQALYSYKLIFNFKTTAGILDYLNQKEISIAKKDIWFF